MNFSDPQSLLGPLCALGSSLTWALGSSVYARQAGRVGAMEVNFSRAAIASPLFFVAAMLSGGLASIGALNLHSAGWLSLSVVCSYGLGDMLFYHAAMRLGTPTALAIASIYPLWATLFGALTLGEHVGGQRLLGTMLCVAGVVWLVFLQAAAKGDSADAQPERHPQHRHQRHGPVEEEAHPRARDVADARLALAVLEEQRDRQVGLRARPTAFLGTLVRQFLGGGLALHAMHFRRRVSARGSPQSYAFPRVAPAWGGTCARGVSPRRRGR